MKTLIKHAPKKTATKGKKKGKKKATVKKVTSGNKKLDDAIKFLFKNKD
ncbi:hypothetical protein [Pedobacter sp. KLB.chiD]